MSVNYDPATHVYWDERGPLISVTQAIREGGLADMDAAQYFNDAARDRGTRLHAALEAWHYGAHRALEAEDLPYWVQIDRFLTDGGFVSESSETLVADVKARYAGTYDLFGRLARFETGKDLIDLKTGDVPITAGPQTMGYRMCPPLREEPLVRRWALDVKPGRYKLKALNVDDETGRLDLFLEWRDENLFKIALCMANFKRQYARHPCYPAT